MSFHSFWCHSIHSNLISSFRCHSIHSNIISSFWCHSIHSDVTPEFLHWDDRTRWKWERFSNQGQSFRFFSWGPLDQWDASILSSRPIGSLDFGSQNFELNLKTGHSDLISSFYAHSVAEWLKKIISVAVSFKRHHMKESFWVVLIHLNVILSTHLNIIPSFHCHSSYLNTIPSFQCHSSH